MIQVTMQLGKQGKIIYSIRLCKETLITILIELTTTYFLPDQTEKDQLVLRMLEQFVLMTRQVSYLFSFKLSNNLGSVSVLSYARNKY